MDFTLITEYSQFWLVPVFFLSIVLVYFQYRRNRRNKDFSKFQLWILGTLRFFVYVGISTLLLSPMISSTKDKVEKPLLIWAQDNSESILLKGDSLYNKGEYQKQVRAMGERISSKFDFLMLTFGNHVSATDTFNFQEKFTDYSQLFFYLKESYGFRNVGAVIVASDGVVNKGNQPVYSLDEISSPIYTVNMGDTTLVRDLALTHVRSNRVAFMNSLIPIGVQVTAHQYKGSRIELHVKQREKVLHREIINVTDEDFVQELNFHIPAGKTGIQHLKLELMPQPGEYTKRNNGREIVVDVLDSKRRILLLYDIYHPDLTALKGAIESNMNYEVKSVKVNETSPSLEEFDLVIFYQLPSHNQLVTSWISEIDRLRLPILIVVGGNSDMEGINSLNLGVKVVSGKEQYEEAVGLVNEKFSLFSIDDYEKRVLKDLPPLLTPFAKWKIPSNSDVFMYQEIKNIDTSLPLVFFLVRKEQKIAFILGEGLWRWKLHNFRIENDHMVFNDLINRIVQYLSLKSVKEQLVVNTESTYSDAEDVSIATELYNESFQQVNDPEVELFLLDSNFKEYRYTFGRRGLGYYLNLGNLPVGDYNYSVKTSLNQKRLKKEGVFAVMAEDAEVQNLQANHRMLYQMSALSGGKNYYPHQLKELEEELLSNPSMLPIVHRDKSYKSVMEYSLLGILLLVLMILEWFLKKYWGSY